MIQTFSVIFCSLILIYACYSDLKTRSVTNKLWLLMIAVGMPIAIYNIFIQGIPFLIRFVFSLFFTFLLSYLFFRMRLFGGADAKSLICIAVLIPTNPLNPTSIFDPFPFAITTLFNAAIVSLIAPTSMFFYNLLSLRSKRLRGEFSLAFIGYKLRVEALTAVKDKPIRLLHSYDKEGKAKFIFGGAEIDEEMIKKLKDYRAQGKIGEDVWVTPGLPYMLFITSGFFISLFYGNLILHILFSLSPP